MWTPKPVAKALRVEGRGSRVGELAALPSAIRGPTAEIFHRFGMFAKYRSSPVASTPAAVPSTTELKPVAMISGGSARPSPSRSSIRRTTSLSLVRKVMLVANWLLRKAARSATVRKDMSCSSQLVCAVMSKTLTAQRSDSARKMRPLPSMLKATLLLSCGSAAQTPSLRPGASWKRLASPAAAANAGGLVACCAQQTKGTTRPRSVRRNLTRRGYRAASSRQEKRHDEERMRRVMPKF